jgi:hypothetical protein
MGAGRKMSGVAATYPAGALQKLIPCKRCDAKERWDESQRYKREAKPKTHPQKTRMGHPEFGKIENGNWKMGREEKPKTAA